MRKTLNTQESSFSTPRAFKVNDFHEKINERCKGTKALLLEIIHVSLLKRNVFYIRI